MQEAVRKEVVCVKFERWDIAFSTDSRMEPLLAGGCQYLVSAVLAARGVRSVEEINEHLDTEYTLSNSPFALRDMDRAVSRIHRAITEGEKIAVFGDYDVDGITATCLLTDYLRSCDADVVFHIPHRLEEGYGLNSTAIQQLAADGVTLIITVDCGVTGVEEVDFAGELGVDVVVTDHHECRDILPAAAAVVDPCRPDCPYPFKHLAGVGVALKLVLALGGPAREETLFARYCVFAAIGTIADVMQMSEENRTIVRRGLDSIEHCSFTGLHALLRETGLINPPITSTQIGYTLAPRINAAGRMGQAELAVQLLLSNDPVEAARLAALLCELNRERQSVEQEIFSSALMQIDALPETERNAIVLADASWHQGVVGIVASRLSEKFSRPCFMIQLSGDSGKGSCRSYGGLNLFTALEHCADLLLGFGGHALAAGFTIRKDDIPAFRRRINRYVYDSFGAEEPVSALAIDVELTQPFLLTIEEVDALRRLEPYGAGNRRPVFCFRGAVIETIQGVGQNRHLKLKLQKGRCAFDCIFFSVTMEECNMNVGDRVDAAFYLQVNEFRGNRNLQLQIVDLRPSHEPGAKEREHMQLFKDFYEQQETSRRDAIRLLPTREQFAAVWRALVRYAGAQRRFTEATLPLLRELSGGMGGVECFLRAMLCLAVFQERGLIVAESSSAFTTITLCDLEDKISLEDSQYLKALHKILKSGKRGVES